MFVVQPDKESTAALEALQHSLINIKREEGGWSHTQIAEQSELLPVISLYHFVYTVP